MKIESITTDVEKNNTDVKEISEDNSTECSNIKFHDADDTFTWHLS